MQHTYTQVYTHIHACIRACMPVILTKFEITCSLLNFNALYIYIPTFVNNFLLFELNNLVSFGMFGLLQ